MTALAPLHDSLSSPRAGPRFSPFQLLPYPPAHAPASVALQQHGSCTWVIKANVSRKEQVIAPKASSASRLQNRMPAFKQAAEPDAFGASIQPIRGADAFSSRNGQSPSSLEEGSARNDSVFTSKLEEILNKFRTREMQSDDVPAVGRRNEAPPSSAQGETTISQRDFFREKRLGNAAKGHTRGRLYNTENATSNVADTFFPLPWERQQASRIQTSTRKGGISVEDPHGVGRRNEAAPSALESATVAHGRKFSREKRQVGMLAEGNTGRLHSTEHAAPDASSLPWKRQWVHSPKSKTQASTRRSSGDYAGAHMTKFSQTYSDPYKDRCRSTRPAKMREAEMNNKSDEEAVLSEFDWTDSDEEDNADAGTSINSEDVARSHLPSKKADQPSSHSSMGATTGNLKPTMNGKVAAWHSHSIPNIPFEFQYSYTETPKAPVIRYREEPFSPFGPDTMGRPWTGGPPLKKSKKNLPQFDSFKPPPIKKGIKYVQPPGPFSQGQSPKPARSREEIHGEPLRGEEIVELVESCRNERRQLNLGRDGLTHNMLDLIHSHWKRRRAIKIRCIGVPTVDMDNVCFHIEDKTGGKIIYKSGGILYLFRGRNYNFKDRPAIPLMLWRPITPVYPKLIKRAPEGLTAEEAYKLRMLGQKIEPLCTLAKNGVYLTLVNDVRAAFKVDDLVRINCRGLNPSDYKKIGAKLRDLVPCVLLSFDDEHILMWKGASTVSVNVDAVTTNKSEDVNYSVAGTEHIKPQASVDDIAGASTLRSGIMSANAESRHDTSTMIGSINHNSSSEDSKKEGFLVWSENDSSSENVLNEDRAKADPLPEYFTPIEETSAIMPGDERERSPVSDSHSGKSGLSIELGSSANDQVHEERVPDPVLKLEKKSAQLQSSGVAGAGMKGVNRAYIIRVDALWDQAIASGMAIELDLNQVDIDSDFVFQQASELDKAVPTVAEYTVKLQKRLWIKRPKPPRPDEDLRMHFANFYKAKLEKKAAKKAHRFRPPLDIPADNEGLPVEELARLLSVK